jgi:hypothetical protein
MSRLSRKCGSLNGSQPMESPRPVTGRALPFLTFCFVTTPLWKPCFALRERKSAAIFCMWRELPRRSILLIIATLICYTAFSRNLFINTVATVKDRQVAKWGMLKGLRVIGRSNNSGYCMTIMWTRSNKNTLGDRMNYLRISELNARFTKGRERCGKSSDKSHTLIQFCLER